MPPQGIKALYARKVRASKTKVMPAVMHDNTTKLPLEGASKLKYNVSMVIVNGQGTEDIINRINFAHSAFPHL